MSVAVTAKHLIDAAVFAARPLAGRQSNPIMAASVLDVIDGRMTVAGFNWEDQARATIEVSGDLPKTLVHGRTLADIAGRLSGEVTLAIEETALVVSDERRSYRLHVMLADSYPGFPADVPPQGAASGLPGLVARVAPSAASNTGELAVLRSVSGVLLKASGDRLSASAMDKYVMSHSSIPWDGEPFTAHVSGRRLADLARRLGEVVELGVGDMFALRDERHYGAMTVLDEAPPNFDVVLNVRQYWDGFGHVDVDRSELLGAISDVKPLFAKFAIVRIRFSASEMELQHDNEDRGAASACIPASLEGDPREAAYNADYLKQALDGLDHDVVRLHFGATVNKPLQITGVVDDAPDMTTRHIVQPIRTL